MSKSTFTWQTIMKIPDTFFLDGFNTWKIDLKRNWSEISDDVITELVTRRAKDRIKQRGYENKQCRQ